VMTDEAGETQWEKRRNPVVRIIRQAGSGGIYLDRLVRRARMEASEVLRVLKTLEVEKTVTNGYETRGEAPEAFYYRGAGIAIHNDYEEKDVPHTPEQQEEWETSRDIQENQDLTEALERGPEV